MRVVSRKRHYVRAQGFKIFEGKMSVGQCEVPWRSLLEIFH